MPFITLESSRKLYYVLRTPAGRNATSSHLVFLLIHGLGSSSSFYGPVMPALVEAGHTCLAFDMNGSSLSNTPESSHKDSAIQDHADDAVALLRALRILPTHVVAVGHSTGGFVAGTLAASLSPSPSPSLISSLAGTVLIGGVTPSEAVSTAFRKRIQIVSSSGMEPLADTIPTSATGSLSTPTHHAFIRALLLSQSPQGYMGMCRAIAEAEAPAYAQATCPALIIAGADDKVVPVASLRETEKSWGGGASLSVLEGVGHWHCIEAGDRISRLLVEFAAKLVAEE